MNNLNFNLCLRFIKEKGLYNEFVKYFNSISKRPSALYIESHKNSIDFIDFVVNWDDTKEGYWFWLMVQLEYALIVLKTNHTDAKVNLAYINDLVNTSFRANYFSMVYNTTTYDSRPDSLTDDIKKLFVKYNFNMNLINIF